MYSTLQRLYTSGKLSMQGLKNAVTKNWITIEQYQEITGEEYVA